MNIKNPSAKQFHITIITFAFLLFIALGLYTQKSFYYWDEIVYIAMSKYFLFGGNAGLFEMIRPPIMPILLMPFGWIAKSPLLLYRYIALAITGGMLAFAYMFTKKYSTKRAGLLVLVAISSTSVFIKYSFRLSSAILAVLFIFLAISQLEKRRYFFAGLIIALAFLTRFPAGTFAISVAGAIIIEEVYEFIRKKRKKDVIINFLKKGLTLFVGFLVPTAIYIIINIITNPQKKILAAAMDPFFYASSAITGGYLWMYEQGIFFYIIEYVKQMPLLALLPFAIIALIVLQIKKKKPAMHENMLIIYVITTMVYFSQLAHKEIRYGILFLPMAIILIILGMSRVCDFFYKKKEATKKKAIIFTIILSITLLFGAYVIVHVNPLGLYQEEVYPAEKTHSFECYEFLEGKTNEAVVATTPYPAVFLSNKIIPSYFTLIAAQEKYQDYKYMIVTPNDFPCEKTNRICQQTNDAIIYDIVKDSNVLFYDSDKDKECIVVTKENPDYLLEEEKRQIKQKVINRFAYQDAIELSITPFAKESSMFLVFNDILPIKKNKVYKEKEFLALMTLLKQKEVPFSLAIIPTSLDSMKNDMLFLLQKLTEQENVEIIQKGYDYTGIQEEDMLAGLAFSEQEQKIKAGKDLIYRYLFTKPEVFFVPYATSDHNTVNALIDNGFETVMTGSYDRVFTGNLQRFDIGVETVTNWEDVIVQDRESLQKQTELLTLKPYILVNFYYYAITEKKIEEIGEYIDWLNEHYYLTTTKQYNEWMEIINDMEYKLTDDEFIIKNVSKYEDVPIGLIVRSDVMLTTNKNDLYIRNDGFSETMVCVNQQCKSIPREKIEKFEGVKKLSNNENDSSNN